MKIGIDISQMQYEGTGVANYLYKLLISMLAVNKGNTFVLFYSSLRNSPNAEILELCSKEDVSLRRFPFPSSVIDVLWNKLHIFPVDKLIGHIDVFISSDWTQPPVIHAKNATILYDLIVYKYPKETADSIVKTQMRSLSWVKKECDLIFCISEATKKDAIEILQIPEEKLRVIYPGV